MVAQRFVCGHGVGEALSSTQATRGQKVADDDDTNMTDRRTDAHTRRAVWPGKKAGGVARSIEQETDRRTHARTEQGSMAAASTQLCAQERDAPHTHKPRRAAHTEGGEQRIEGSCVLVSSALTTLAFLVLLLNLGQQETHSLSLHPFASAFVSAVVAGAFVCLSVRLSLCEESHRMDSLIRFRDNYNAQSDYDSPGPVGSFDCRHAGPEAMP